MKKGRFLRLGVVLLASMLTIMPAAPKTFAQPALEVKPQINIKKFKITSGSQFIEMFNGGSESMDMSRIQLAYYNNYDLAKATSSKLVSLSGSLEAGSYYLVNDSAVTLCYQTLVASASLGFSTTSGMVQVLYLHQAEPGGQFVSKVLDSVSWSKSKTEDNPHVTPLPAGNPEAFMQKIDSKWTEVWPSINDACQYETSGGEFVEEGVDEAYVFKTSSLPPVRYVANVTENKVRSNRNVGKMAPVINEMLPNPASPQTDADDEFIELYNPNDSGFDLSDFKLAFGSTNPRKYTFPEGTIIKPKEFKAFTSADTSISLSNSKAQVWLLDPNGQVVNSSDPYSSAKDGMSWALDNDKWVWTGVPTPNEMNAISAESSSASSTKTASAVLGINNSTNIEGAAGNLASTAGEIEDKVPLHPAVLVGVGVAALGYAMYEYRHDMSNKIFQFRRYLSRRRAVR